MVLLLNRSYKPPNTKCVPLSNLNYLRHSITNIPVCLQLSLASYLRHNPWRITDKNQELYHFSLCYRSNITYEDFCGLFETACQNRDVRQINFAEVNRSDILYNHKMFKKSEIIKI